MRRANIRHLVSFLTLALAAGAGAAEKPPSLSDVAKRKLVSAAFFPMVTVSRGVSLTGTDPPLDPAAELRAAQAQAQAHPHDSAAQLRLASAYAKSGRTREEEGARSLAASLAESRTKLLPEDAGAWTRLGDALSACRRWDEAEAAHRRATQLARADWRTWAGLGEYLSGRSLAILFDLKAEPGAAPPLNPLVAGASPELLGRLLASSALDRILEQIRNPERLAAAQKELDESEQCYQRAADLHSDDVTFYLQRWASGMMRREFAAVIERFRAGKPSREDLAGLINRSMSYMFQPEAVDDLRNLARAHPAMPRLTMSLAILELTLLFQKGVVHGEPGDPKFWRELPPDVRASFEAEFERLAVCSRGADPKVAAEAAEGLGVLRQVVAGDDRAAADSLRLAIKLDPNRGQAWAMLAGIVTRGPDPVAADELYARFRGPGKTPVGWLVFAKYHTKRKQPKLAEEDVKSALAANPTDLNANLAWASLLLSEGSPASTTKAGAVLGQVQDPGESTPGPSLHPDYQRLQGVYLALSGRTAEARKLLEEALKALEAEQGDPEAAEKLKQALAELGAAR